MKESLPVQFYPVNHVHIRENTVLEILETPGNGQGDCLFVDCYIERLPYRVFIGEMPRGKTFGNRNCIFFRQRIVPVPGNKRESEEVEKIGIHSKGLLLESLVPDRRRHRETSEKSRGDHPCPVRNLRENTLHLLLNRRASRRENPVAQQIDIFRTFKSRVIRQLREHVIRNEDDEGHRYGEACHLYGRIKSVPSEESEKRNHTVYFKNHSGRLPIKTVQNPAIADYKEVINRIANKLCMIFLQFASCL